MSGKFKKGEQGPEDSRRSTFDFPPVDKERTYPIIDVMREMGEVHDVSVSTVALAWLLAKEHTTSVIIGAKRSEQLTEDLKASSFRLDADDIKRLDEMSELRPGISRMDEADPKER